MLLPVRSKQGDVSSEYLIVQKGAASICLVVLWDTPGQFLREITETSFDICAFIQ